jgi:esterase/lipase
MPTITTRATNCNNNNSSSTATATAAAVLSPTSSTTADGNIIDEEASMQTKAAIAVAVAVVSKSKPTNEVMKEQVMKEQTNVFNNLSKTKQKEFVESFNEIKSTIFTLYNCDDSVYDVKSLYNFYDD